MFEIKFIRLNHIVSGEEEEEQAIIRCMIIALDKKFSGIL